MQLSRLASLHVVEADVARSFPTTGLEDQEGTTGDAVNQGSSPTFRAPKAQGTSKKKMAGQTRLTERKEKVHETGREQRVTSRTLVRDRRSFYLPKPQQCTIRHL